MMAYKEYIGCKSVEAVNYDGNGNDICSMWLTDTEIIRCRDCKHFRTERAEKNGQRWMCSGVFAFIEPNPDGFCAWAVMRDGLQILHDE